MCWYYLHVLHVKVRGAMFKLFASLIDRCIFTLAFIIGVQFPEFIQQYSQRLSGHLNEALQQLDQFQLIANRHFQGRLADMIQKYSSNIEPSISETGALIVDTSNRVTSLQSHLVNIEQADYFKRLYAFITQYDLPMAQATLQQYKLAIPLDMLALLSGAILALCILIIIHSFVGSMKLMINWLVKVPKKKENTLNTEQVLDTEQVISTNQKIDIEK